MVVSFRLSDVIPVLLVISVLAVRTGSAQQCSVNECERPQAQLGLSLTIDKTCYIDGDVIVYNCTGDHFGPPDNYCDGIAGWRYSQPACSEESSSCGRVNIPENGLISDMEESYGLYATIDITCNSGYVLVGASSKVCDRDGAFKPTAEPICAETIVATTAKTTEPGSSSAEPESSSTEPTKSSETIVATTAEPTEPGSLSAEPESSSTEPTKSSEAPITEAHPSSPQPEGAKNWNGLIIGLSVGVGCAIILLVAFIVLSNAYWKNAKGGLAVSPAAEGRELAAKGGSDDLSLGGSVDDDDGLQIPENHTHWNKSFDAADEI